MRIASVPAVAPSWKLGPYRELTLSDAGFLYLDRPHAALNIGAIAVLDGAIRTPDLIERLREQARAARRYAERPVASLLGAAHPRWEECPDFDPARHVQRWALPERAGDADLFELAARLVALPLDRARPLWRVDQIDLCDGRSALVHTIHHCMVDGMSGAFMLDRLFDPLESAPAGAAVLPPVLPRPRTGLGRRLADELREATRRPVRQASQLVRTLGSPVRARAAREWLLAGSYEAVRLGTREIPRMPWNAPLAGRRQLVPVSLPQAAIRRVRQAFGATANDVLLCIVAGGLHRYLEATGTSTRALELSALVPVSLRSPADAAELGNHLSAMLVPLATDLDREAVRLVVTQRITEQLKATAAWTRIEALLDLLEHAPAWLVRLGARTLSLARIANLVATSVPGPREPRTLLGARVGAIHPVVPIADGIGLGIAALSYADHLHVTLHADARLVPDLEKLRQGIQESFADLAGAA
jgi:WS/DGAT/MGAT family acyltransferase